jgi:Flp pilus assembly protein TadD
MNSLPIAVILLALAAPAGAASKPDAGLDGLFARLAKAPSTDDAKPIEKEILTHFLQSKSATVDLLMTRASALLGAGDGETAAHLLDAVTKIAPAYAEGWHQKGKVEADAGHDVAAMVSLQKAVTLNPREFEALVDLGDMLAQYGAKPQALAQYKRALALDPQFDGLDRRVEQLAREVEGEKI